MYYGSKYREMKQLENSAGEIEQDRTSKRANLIEVLLLYGLAQFAMWFLIGYGGMGLNSQLLNILGYLILALAIIWAVFLSPYYHADTWHGIGFGRPMELFTIL